MKTLKLLFVLALIATPAFAANGGWTKTIINGNQTLWGISYTTAALVTTTTPPLAVAALPAGELSFLIRPVSGTGTISASIWGQLSGKTGNPVGPSATIIGVYGVGTGQYGGSLTTVVRNQSPIYGLTVTQVSPSTQIDIYALERSAPASPQNQINP